MRLISSLPLLLTLASRAQGQVIWRSGTEIGLVGRAAASRLVRDADTLLAAWRATAHGVVRFASEVDHGSGPIERVIRADELRVEVYGEAPNRSKQIIVAWRDTSFLPNRVSYHRDHLGIVANDLGGVIRLGEGDEVRDLVHPLSQAGLTYYQFATGDTLTLAGAAGQIRVVAVQVRPADAAAAAAVGTLYLDLDRAALVRFRFTFTPASYRDPSVENITVTLENALQENARWLPWRQSIVIRRGMPLLDLPLRTLLRADWSLTDYRLGIAHPPGRFTGPLVAGLRRPAVDSSWTEPLTSRLESLPATAADVAAIEVEASRALGGRLLGGLPGSRLLANGVSELLHINRVQGVTLQLGGRFSLGRGLTAQVQGGFGFSDLRAVGRIAFEHQRGGTSFSVLADRVVADVANTPIISGALNSLRTAVAGEDRGDYVRLEHLGAGVRFNIGDSRIALRVGQERSWSVASEFFPIRGRSAANPALGAGRAIVMAGSLIRRAADGRGWSLDAEGGSGDRRWARLVGEARLGRLLGPGALEVHVMGGLGTSGLPGYRSFVLGGRGSLPGVAFRSVGGRRAGLLNVGWLLPVGLPGPPIPNVRRIRLPSVVGPFLAAGVAGGELPLPWRATGRIESVAGLRADLWGPLLRLEAGVSLRTGHIGVTLDIHPDWWPVL